MQDYAYASSDVSELAKAMISVQSQLQPVIKDSTNPFTQSTYATLNKVMDSCKSILLKHKIWLTQYPVPAENGHLGLVTKLTHVESGQYQASLAVVPLPKNDPQGMGCAITYARRYALSAMLGIVTEDDTDGEMRPLSEAPKARKTNTEPVEKKTQPKSDDNKFPDLDGVYYDQSFNDNGELVILARGKTVPHKQELSRCGFRWDPNLKAWWIKA